MSSHDRDAEDESAKTYGAKLRQLQIELVKLQRHIIKHEHKLLILFEGRDASGKDGTIKHIVEHLSPRETRVVALGKPSDRERGSWYFQRYVAQLPAAGEMVLFNRSWYNRAGVERVMGFCTEDEYGAFLTAVPVFERMLIDSGIQLVKYYLDISRSEQKKRLEQRREDPLKQWKISPIDEVALKHWDDYSRARDAMLERTHTPLAPWIVVRADDKRQARLNVIRDLMARSECPDKDEHHARPDAEIVFPYSSALLRKRLMAS
jgi:polyphosphate kinase 2